MKNLINDAALLVLVIFTYLRAHIFSVLFGQEKVTLSLPLLVIMASEDLLNPNNTCHQCPIIQSLKHLSI